jgi:pimeloyl-ACP methyl ester carboxylesterase
MKRILIPLSVVLALCAAAVASAQVASERTWPELKQAVQERAERDAYPLTGMKPDDVREILARINSLDRDEWAAAWSATGARYAARGDELAASDRAAAAQAYLMAFRYYAFGAWPTQNSAGKKTAFEGSLLAFQRYAQLRQAPLEAVRVPFEGKEVRGWLALPPGAAAGRPAPVVLAIGGLDSYKEHWAERAEAFLKAGLGVLCLDMPGTGEAPIKVDVGAERMYSAVLDYLMGRRDVDQSRLAAVGVSWGGYWSAILAYTEKARLRGSVYWAGPVDRYFMPQWQRKALGTREYLFDLFAARASVYGVATLDDFLRYGPRMSLAVRGFIGEPTTAMLLINGEKDTQVPIDDLYLLLRSGTAKDAWINPEGGHTGRGGGFSDERILGEVAVPWLAHLLRAE